jgi:hypothetical protein
VGCYKRIIINFFFPLSSQKPKKYDIINNGWILSKGVPHPDLPHKGKEKVKGQFGLPIPTFPIRGRRKLKGNSVCQTKPFSLEKGILAPNGES